MLKRRVFSAVLSVVMIGGLVGCAGWTEEDDGRFMAVCNAGNDEELGPPCSCTLEKLKASTGAEEFFALDKSGQLAQIYAASASGQCATWDDFVTGFDESCQEDKMHENMSDEMMAKFCSCASSKIKEAKNNPMEVLIQSSGMTDTQVARMVFKDMSASACFNWDMVDVMFECDAAEDELTQKACGCVVEQAKADFKTAGNLFNVILDSMPETKEPGVEPVVDFMEWTQTAGKTCGEKMLNG